MFVGAIEKAGQFTRPVHTIFRFLGSTDVHPGAATFFVVNSEGWALTCRHVVQQFLAENELRERYGKFRAERDAMPGKKSPKSILKLAAKQGFTATSIVEIKNRFLDSVSGGSGPITFTLHPTLDIALVKFTGFEKLLCSGFPVFAADGGGLRQGLSLCRLGFPFPEFRNYAYDPGTDSIDWTKDGKDSTPRFPIEGMMTRQLADSKGSITGFELSTPGLRGQSGGPAFDTEGRVWGMQSSTNHLDLDFDVDMEVLRRGAMQRVRDSAFLHVGHCIHVNVLKAFMTEHVVSFAQG